MTLVDADTGEVVDLMGEDEARLLVGRVNRAAVDMVNSIERIWSGRGWLALGYDSWDELCESEFSDMPRLGREQRAELVRSLRSLGMSTRAIASASGVSKDTVARDLRGVSDETPADPVTGNDGKTYQPTQPAKTTVTERESFSRKTETDEPAPVADGGPGGDPPSPPGSVEQDEAEVINQAFERHVDPAADYRLHVTKRLDAALNLKQLDIEKAVATAGDSADGHRLSVESIRDWCESYLAAARPNRLRRVK